ncbi:hypothetical protein MIR68_003551 [Amoeboaphelidium protococcarum]|nr:hypothetical protein MIR68_003551 [Amoeboaphelidium protococcarum]
MKEYTREEVQKHDNDDSFWIVIDGIVYDLTVFKDMHPGGTDILTPYGGKDATEVFYALHRHDVLNKYGPKYAIGRIQGEKQMVKSGGTVISKVPYAEAAFWQSGRSAYYKETHIKFKQALRKFFTEEILPEAKVKDDLDEAPSKELFEKCGQFGLWASRLGPGHWMKGRQLPGGVKPEEFDYFHELIAHEEIQTLGYPGFSDGLACGLVIGLPPLLHFGSAELQKRVVPDILDGKKRICLSITEPFCGSDVSAIQTTAKLSDDGKYYIVNGVKKWITNGHHAQYFTTAVRTGGKGMNGISMLLIERSPGLRTKPIKTAYSSSAGTSLVIMENVKVPVENLLGKLNEGFKTIMFNFNHERWLIVCQSVRASRLVVEECFKWAMQRQVFGKPLISQPVIREKLAQMISRVEATQSWLESITYQMSVMSYKEQSLHLAGPIALLKLFSTRSGEFVCDQACQIFGGRAITSTGMGQVVERYRRATKFAAILGGSEEIMADLAIRQAIKMYPKSARL